MSTYEKTPTLTVPTGGTFTIQLTGVLDANRELPTDAAEVLRTVIISVADGALKSSKPLNTAGLSGANLTALRDIAVLLVEDAMQNDHGYTKT